MRSNLLFECTDDHQATLIINPYEKEDLAELEEFLQHHNVKGKWHTTDDERTTKASRNCPSCKGTGKREVS